MFKNKLLVVLLFISILGNFIFVKWDVDKKYCLKMNKEIQSFDANKKINFRKLKRELVIKVC